jgi:nicotinamide-nucleotide amidase
MWFEKDRKVIIALPGVPFEMVSIMEDEGLPRLKERFTSDALLHRSIITAGEGESYIAEKIKDLEEALPAHIRLAYLPGAGMVRLRLTGRGADAKKLAAELDAAQTAIAERIENIVVALEDIPLEHVLGNWFNKNGKTLGLAESCTGGNMAHHLTQIKGASGYFKGCIVCYSIEIKQKVLGVASETIDKYSAISEETVTEMAKGALKVLDVDYAYAVTGILDSDGELYGAPSGTVWMAVADQERVVTKKFYFPFDRLRNKDMATSMGMLMIWKFINNKT